MVTTAITKQTDMMFGNYGDLQQFAKRIKTLCKGGDKLSDNEALALAQVASVTHLNPFIGEVWYIPGKGPMVGIAGARRLEQERTGSQGGFSFPIVSVVAPEEAGALTHEINDVVAAFKVEINDSTATAEYQKLLVSTIEAMRAAGVSDPFGAAKEVCGVRPVWVGYGFSKKTDQSTMNKVQLARKRAEADALKKRIVIPFGGTVAETDIAPEYNNAPIVADETKEPVLEGIEVEPENTVVETDAMQMYRYNDAVVVSAVKKITSFTAQEAAATLHEAFKKNQIGKTLTLGEVEEFARNLVSPK